MENKPKLLYRGLKINYDNLSSFNFYGVDLNVNYAPIIDKFGRKTVTDGNEYGVYMSDNLSMVMSAYGSSNHFGGIPINKNLLINNEPIRIPPVSVIYEINTDDLDIRKPFITEQLKGHYNNGFQGDEWIADIVPAKNYKLYRVSIGRDILHEAEDIDLSNPEQIKNQVNQKLEIRKYRLRVFSNAMENYSLIRRNNITRDEMSILRIIYGQNGLKYINEETIIADDINGMLKYLVAKVFKNNEFNIDFKTIKYINSLKDRAKDIDSLIEVLMYDKQKNIQDKIEFEIRKKREGVSYQTTLYDNKDKLFNGLIYIVNYRKKKDNLYSKQLSDNEIGEVSVNEVMNRRR